MKLHSVKAEKHNYKTSGSKKLRKLGTITAVFLSSAPVIYYLYDLAPRRESWELFFFTLEIPGFQNLNIFFWVFLGKLMPLVLLLFWFFTCKHWWYRLILIPIAMYLAQLVSIFNPNQENFDELEFFYILPFMTVLIPIVYIARIKWIDKYVHGIDLDAIKAEIREIEQVIVEGKVDDYLYKGYKPFADKGDEKKKRSRDDDEADNGRRGGLIW